MSTVVRIGRTDNGLLVRIEGRGTLHESLAFHELIANSFKRQGLALAIDLTDCEYLDSTFLGCLVKLHNRFSGEEQAALSIVAPSDRAQQLLGPMQLDKLFEISPTPPDVAIPLCSISADALTSADLGRHAAECHRQLAALGGPHQEIFESLAAQLEQELDEGS